MKFDRYYFDVWTGEWYLIPTVKIRTKLPEYCERCLIIEIHVLYIHLRWVWRDG